MMYVICCANESTDCLLQVHDAYIELVQLLEPSDPQAALAVYCEFPAKPAAEQSFDDAFITGEIVRMLMAMEQYDHPQLGPSLISYGKVMGIGQHQHHKNQMCCLHLKQHETHLMFF